MNTRVLVAYATKADSTREVAEVVARTLHRDARRFLCSHRAELAERPLAVFAMGPQPLGDDEVAAGLTPVAA